MTGDDAQTELRAAFAEWIAVERELAEELHRFDPLDPDPSFAEGYQHLIRLMSSASLMYMEMDDADNPRFYRDTDDMRKLMLDNPDSYYLRARVSPEREYSITGKLGNSIYNSFSVETSHISEIGHVVLAQRELAEFADSDGNIKIWLGGEVRERNWLPLDPGAHTVFIRQTFAEMAGRRPSECHIEALGDRITPRPDAAQTARRLRECAAFARWWCRRAYAMSDAYMALPNRMMAAGRSKRDPGGDRSIDYSGGSWRLEEDEALVIKLTRTSPYLYWGFHINSRWAESLDYRYYKVGYNNFQATSDADGGWTIVLSHRQVRAPNWLWTQGRREGILTLRWLKVADEPPLPELKVVKIDTFPSA